MKILNWFPKPKSITELTLLSKYELIIYGVLLIIASSLYYSWQTIPVKDIYIEADRIDNHTISSIGSDSILANIGYISLKFKLSDSFNDSTPSIETRFSPDVKVSKTGVDRSTESLAFTYFHEKNLDSLYHSYDSLCQLYSLPPIKPMFHQKIITSIDEIRFSRLHDKTYILCKGQNGEYGFTSLYHESSFMHSNFCYESFGDYFWGDQTYGPFKPFILDLHDISQCYYRIKIRTQLVNRVYLKLSFWGANDFTFIDTEPDSINGQQLFYNFEHDYLVNGIKKDFVFHVYSKELAGKQSSRMFFITALLSALITIFLAFLIIYLYRKIQSRINKNQIICNIDDDESKQSAPNRRRLINRKSRRRSQNCGHR